MARARNIKPAFFTNDDLGELTPLERLAFIGMWTIADFKGCIEFKPKRLKVQILPYDECDFELIAINLDKSGFIKMYSVQGQRYLKIVNFEKHQNPHKNEREAGSELPELFESTIKNNELNNIEINPDKNGTTRADSLIPITDSLKLIPVKKHTRKNNALVYDDYPEFLDFWYAYPKSDGKKEALKSWHEKKPPIDKVLQALSWQNIGYAKIETRFIPNASTYINQERWHDEPQEERAAF